MPTYVDGARYDVAVIGLGFVGLPAAIMFANSGLRVAGVDIDLKLLAMLRQGRCPIDEPAMHVQFEAAFASGNFDVLDATPVSDAYVICVPTPLREDRKTADLSAVTAAMTSLSPSLRAGALVVVESTVPPLTCERLVKLIISTRGLMVGAEVFVAHCPERLYPGNVLMEITTNDRIIGGMCSEATRRAVELYGNFVSGKLLETDVVTAEFCKLIENTYRDVNIGLANEFYFVAEKLGLSIRNAIKLANRHPRVSILEPGIGVGGHCIPIDPWFIVEAAPEQASIIPAARRVNDSMPRHVAARIREAVAEIADPVIGFCGVAYKPDVNDQRESPAKAIIETFRKEGWRYEIFDPICGPGAAYGSLREFAKGKDVLVILVPHSRFHDELGRDYRAISERLGARMILQMSDFGL